MTISSIEQDRLEAGISQKDLCDAAEVHPTTYTAIKNGRRGGNVATIEKLRRVLDTLRQARRSEP